MHQLSALLMVSSLNFSSSMTRKLRPLCCQLQSNTAWGNMKKKSATKKKLGCFKTHTHTGSHTYRSLMILDSRWLFKANRCVKSCHVAHNCTASDIRDKAPAMETDRLKEIHFVHWQTILNIWYINTVWKQCNNKKHTHTLNIDLAFSKIQKIKRTGGRMAPAQWHPAAPIKRRPTLPSPASSVWRLMPIMETTIPM